MKTTIFLFLALALQTTAFSQTLPKPELVYPGADNGATPRSYPDGKGPVVADNVAVFDGLDFVAFPKLLRGRSAFTVAVWFNPAGAGNMRLLGAERGHSLEISEAPQTEGKLRWAQFTERWSPPLYSSDHVRPGEWNHVTVVYDGAEMRLFLNGKKQAAGASQGAVTPSGDTEFIGTYTETMPGKFTGQIARAEVYGMALDDAQVGRLSADTSPCRAAPLSAAKPCAPVDFHTADGKLDALKIVRAYADLMLERGRDTYGPAASPLFASALDRRNFRIGSFPSVAGVRGHDRVTVGANVMCDENLYQILYALSEITGSPSYAKAADEALGFFLKHAQSPATGLLAWGEHLGWNFKTEDVLTTTKPGQYIHEFARPWQLWPRCHALNPEACEAYASGLWNHQIQNQKTGMFSRHALWDRHGPQAQNEYPRHGGFYIATWAFMYGKTKSNEFPTAIETLVDMYERYSAQNPGAVPCSTYPGRTRMMWTASNLSLAIDLEQSAAGMPPRLREKMKALAGRIDAVFLRLKHDFTNGETGFVATADIHTLEPLFNTKEWLPYTRPWLTGYGFQTDAEVANLCHERQKLTADKTTRDAYRRLILTCADRYLDSEPDLSKPVYPGTFGAVIWHLLDAAEISNDEKYVGRARFFADMAVRTFMPGGIPLPTASSVNTHYEAITKGDSLMLSLLRLAGRDENTSKTPLQYCDR